MKNPAYRITFLEAVLRFYLRYANFKGRATRAEYWFVWLYIVLANIVVNVITVFTPKAGLILGVIFSFGSLVPGLALFARRLHDIGRRALPCLAFFIASCVLWSIGVQAEGRPGVMLLLLAWAAGVWPFVLWVLAMVDDSCRGRNRWGDSEKYPEESSEENPFGGNPFEEAGAHGVSAFCASCGTRLTGTENFCPNCGKETLGIGVMTRR